MLNILGSFKKRLSKGFLGHKKFNHNKKVMKMILSKFTTLFNTRGIKKVNSKQKPRKNYYNTYVYMTKTLHLI